VVGKRARLGTELRARDSGELWRHQRRNKHIAPPCDIHDKAALGPIRTHAVIVALSRGILTRDDHLLNV
jgi:hypothetical protein